MNGSCDNDEQTRLHTPIESSIANSRAKNSKARRRKIVMISGITVGFCLIIFGIYLIFFTHHIDSIESNIYDVSGDNIVDTLNCQIPNINPFSIEAMKVFKKVKYKPCSKTKPLTSVKTDNVTGKSYLLIHENIKSDHLSWWQNEVKCCFKNVKRLTDDEKSADMKVEYSSCVSFFNNHQLTNNDEFIIVECTGYREFLGLSSSNIVYKDAYAIVNTKENVNEKLKRHSNTKDDKLSVFLVGIDSISRLNLIRAMPETYKYVEKTGWFELRGYNKIDDNTFPNLMAILTGQNKSAIDESCDWRQVGELEKCEFMWNLYNNSGYVTAYAEDEAKISTFNYFETGFINPPTDYYFRPFGIAAQDNLKVKMEHGLTLCLGDKNYADYIVKYGTDFAEKFRGHPQFAFLWSNSFSHEDLSMVTQMDVKVKTYLQQLDKSGILNSSIVMFFSDHGMRFGNIRKYFTGWLEERLPFFYLWLPPWFQSKYPEIVQNLKINRDRLTTPYDVHVTLKHILKMSKSYDGDLSAVSCPSCQSLFDEISANRSCEDAGINKHWCTCAQFNETDKNTFIVRNAVNHVIKKLNNELKTFPKCAELKFKSIHSARISSRMKTQKDYLISFQVSPSDAELEATIRCEGKACGDFHLVGSVSRLNRYGNQSSCISDATMRKYCYCV